MQPRAILSASLLSIAAGSLAASCVEEQRPILPAAPPPTSAPPPQEPATPARLTELLRPLVVASSAHDLIKNATFDGPAMLPWMPQVSAPAAADAHVVQGALCVDVTSVGAHPWDVQVRHRHMTIRKGHTYGVRFKIGATAATQVNVKVAMSGPPYLSYWRQELHVGPAPQVVTGQFTMGAADDATAEMAFELGETKSAAAPPFTVCVDDVVLEDPDFTPAPEATPAPVPAVLVNQVGYFPALAKVAIVRSDATSPQSWQLHDAAGATVASGYTIVHGPDAASGDRVHWADFSSWTTPGRSFSVHVGSDASPPFDVVPWLYAKLRADALAYFYQSRSGVPIEMPYAGDPKWTRPAGHVSDRSVPCAPDAGCDDTLDVSGGWYDAGDQGKYVVSGAISVWTLVDLYERAKAFGAPGAVAALADGTANIPEHHNGVPDLLDEARFEIEFLMKMQVPDGKPLAGMVHHKVHDQEWTALGTRPEDDKVPRFLRPVSTAATLDLAAVGAQCARVWKGIDAAFAARCLASAERAWTAAEAHPGMLAPASDHTGGGPYEDDDVSDERYWAACELYVATGKDAYKEALGKSPHHLEVLGPPGGRATAMTWQKTQALGTITLAVAPSALPKADVAQARAAIVAAADAFVGAEHAQGYRVPMAVEGALPWGSNSDVLNNAIVLGLAYDAKKDRKYLDAAASAMSYILGRNPNDQSYVTGYGSRPLLHPHHRFWAQEANPALPPPPPGILSGGPNSGLQDPYVQAAGLRGCAPMKCFADDIESYSTNEEAINWNAPLVWVAAFLEEQGSRAR